jgi:hypothetical protein
MEITVPEDADVRVTGFGFMGGFDHGHTQLGLPGGPVIRIKGLAFMGGVGLKRRAPARSGNSELPQRTEARGLAEDA